MSSDKTHTHSDTHKPKKARRRPGRDPIETDHHDEPETTHEESSTAPDRKKVKLEFYGSDILKQKAPTAFELAENVAEEWVNDGRFEDIPVESPLAKAFATYSLRKAKKIEKKLEEKGVIALVKIGIDYAQSKMRR
ncbi:MAG: hypothetical protein AABY64_10350 [Bdellovibrionota bacterium]